MQTWQLYSQTYPNDDIPTSNLSVLYARLGDYESALKFSLKGIQLAPDSNYGYLKAACAYDGLGRFEEAKAIADESIKKWAIRPFAHTMLLNTAIAQGDTAAEEKQMALAAEDTSDMIRFVWPAQAGRGQLQKSQEFLREWEEASRREGPSELTAAAICNETRMEVLLTGKSKQKFDPSSVLAVSNPPDVKSCVATTLALSGRESEAVRLADELAKARPQDTWYRAMWIPAIRAQIELNHGNAGKALELLESAQPYDNAYPSIRRLRGQAFLLNRQFKEAETEFQAAIKVEVRRQSRPRRPAGTARSRQNLRRPSRFQQSTLRLSEFSRLLERCRSGPAAISRRQIRIRKTPVSPCCFPNHVSLQRRFTTGDSEMAFRKCRLFPFIRSVKKD